MPEKFWIQDFATDMDRLRVHFIVERGRIKSIRVVQYEAFIDGEWREIVRFDEAHGFFHRDVILPGGGQEKTALPAVDKNVALNEAISHIKRFWRTYRRTYEGKYYEK